MKQPVYGIALATLVQIVHEASERHQGLRFGAITPEEFLQKVHMLNTIPGIDPSVVKMGGVTSIIDKGRTNKLLGGANRGLDYIQREITKSRVEIR
jgi:hypothetical protein